jgi:dihydroflavonol-4-reductase
VTGASGLLGFALVRRLLEDGRHVRTLTRYRTRYLADLPIEFVEGDLTDEESLHSSFEGVEAVYHAAGLVSLDPRAWPALRALNVEGTRTIISLCRKHGVRRLIHVSSLEVFRTDPLTQPLDETRPLIAEDVSLPYPRSKVQSHRLVERAAAEGLDVRDVAAGAVRAEQVAPPGATYILSNEWASVRAIAALVEAAGGAPSPRFSFPVWLAYLGIGPMHLWSSLRGRQSLYTRQSLTAALTSNHRIRHDRATADLDYQPRPLEHTVTDTVNWLEETGQFTSQRKSLP